MRPPCTRRHHSGAVFAPIGGGVTAPAPKPIKLLDPRDEEPRHRQPPADPESAKWWLDYCRALARGDAHPPMPPGQLALGDDDGR